MFGLKTNFLRRFFRRVMKPMTVQEAQDKKALIAKIYCSISFALFCSVCYQVKKGRLNWLEAEGLIPEEETKISSAFQYARMLGVEKATVIRMKGIEVLATKEYDKETFDIHQHIKDEETSTVDLERKFLSH